MRQFQTLLIKSFLIIMSLIFSILLIVNFLMSKKMKTFTSDSLIFECGFDSIYWYFNKFSIHFFKIGIIFILFDLELMYLLLILNNSKLLYILIWLILNFIIFTLFIEFYFNNLNWVL